MKPGPKPQASVIEPCPKPPEHLVGVALEEWNRLAEGLNAAGKLNHRQQTLLALYCDAWADYLQQRAAVVEEPILLYRDNGTAYRNPHFVELKDRAARVGSTAKAAGLVSIKTTEKEAKPADDEIEDMIRVFQGA